VRSGPVVIGYDGSPAAEAALCEAAPLLAPSPALVVVVWEAGLAFELAELPTIPPAPIDIRAAIEIDEKLYERAQRLAQQGAALACAAGLEAEGLAVADVATPGATLVRIIRESDARAVVLGSHGHGGLTEVLLGSTSREVMGQAPCPVVVVRGPAPGSPLPGSEE
jgi:nucleotide-binding universal stress UspA family protein